MDPRRPARSWRWPTGRASTPTTRPARRAYAQQDRRRRLHLRARLDLQGVHRRRRARGRHGHARHAVQPAAADPGRRPHDLPTPRTRGRETLTTAQILAAVQQHRRDHHRRCRRATTRFAHWVDTFGFGTPTGVDLPGEERGIVPPSPTSTPARRWATCRSGRASGDADADARRPTRRSPTAGSCAPRRSSSRSAASAVPSRAGQRVISAQTARRAAHDARGRPRPGGTASEVDDPRLQAGRQDRHRQQGRPRAPASTPRTRYIASFVGFAPAADPKLLVAVVVDEPQGEIYGGQVAAPAFEQIMAFALPYLQDRARAGGVGSSGVCCWETSSTRPSMCRRRTSRSRSLAYDNRDAPAPGRCSSASAASPATATTSRPTRSAAAPPRWWCERPLGLRRAAGRSCVVRAAMAPAAARFHGDPTARARRRRHHRHQRQDDHRVPRARRCWRPRAAVRRCSARSRRSSAASSAAARAHDAGGDRAAGRLRARCAPAATGLRDGGLLPRARAAPRRRDPLGGGDVHQPDAGPPRLPRRRWRTTSRPSGGCSSRPSAPCGWSTSTTPTAAGWRRDFRRRPSPFAIDADADMRAPRRPLDADRLDAFTPGRDRAAHARCPGRFNVANVLGAVAAARALGVDDATIAAAARRAPAACPAASSPSTRGSRSRCSSTTPTRRTRWRTCCAPRAS